MHLRSERNCRKREVLLTQIHKQSISRKSARKNPHEFDGQGLGIDFGAILLPLIRDAIKISTCSLLLLPQTGTFPVSLFHRFQSVFDLFAPVKQSRFLEKQVEKRLASENNNTCNNKNPPHDPLPPSSDTKACSSQSLGSPIYLGRHQQPSHNDSSSSSSLRLLQDSDPPQEFLSHSIDFPETQKDPLQHDDSKHAANTRNDEEDDIDQLIALLGLSDCGHDGKRLKSVSCLCDGGFSAKVGGVKGPKCEVEMERLQGWIGYFLNGVEKKEPLRLAHLLLGKAAIMDGTDFGGIDFPATLEDFLHNDPPTA